ncbi:UbiX family flavin prenyltransferase [Candidatus Poribacteria bacterium]|nr:UbiX family flavin prenyltransferase [Candidatus Poribacteria bacterium]MDE0690387.1 UbiX family flavin prenyltransferase [Candidatus Poribacteria bacterium]MXV83444.1 UbiX family flavin prenyltransferase [Candidatus Poribacteria bacterium]MYA56155.1 UbiX family flavin prenyltransferase [Candidatus Poribacteria bacterium]
MKRLIVGITGASAGVYGVRLLQVLTEQQDIEIHLTISSSGARALSEELQLEVDLNNFKLESLIGVSSPRVIYHHESDIAAPIASGSFRTEGMVVVPCSMGSVASIAGGMSRNLIQRAADVCIKENRKLVIVPRETPLSPIHLENMLKLSRLGVCVLPAMPGFYHYPKDVDDLLNFVVTKILDQFGIDTGLIQRWKEF